MNLPKKITVYDLNWEKIQETNGNGWVTANTPLLQNDVFYLIANDKGRQYWFATTSTYKMYQDRMWSYGIIHLTVNDDLFQLYKLFTMEYYEPL